MQEFDCVIIGAGPVGLFTAITLSRQFPNYSFALIDAADMQQRLANVQNGIAVEKTSFDQRTFVLNTATLAVLAGQDIDLAYAQPITAVNVCGQNAADIQRYRVTSEECMLDKFGATVVNIQFAQAITKRWITNCQARTTVFSATTTSKITPRSDGVKLTLSDNTTVHTNLLCICDGSHSATAGLLGIQYESSPYLETAYAGRVQLLQPHHSAAFQLVADAVTIVLVPLPDLDNKPQAGIIQLTQQQPLKPAALNAIGSGQGWQIASMLTPLARWPLQRVIAREVVRRHIAVFGNAAQSVHPLAAQGINMALQHVAAFSRYAGSTTNNELWPALHQLQQQVFADRASKRLAAAMLLGILSSPLRSQTSRAIGLLNTIPKLRTIIAKNALG